MDQISYKTATLKKSEIKHNWLIINAEGLVLGRMASRAAYLLRGKHKASYTPNLNCGDKVIIINAEKVRLTGRKLDQREMLTYSGYQGGQKAHTPRMLLEKYPARLIEWAIKGMLPKGKLGSQIYTNLYVYAGSEHPHAAQEPKSVKI
jgi:large subunit ribosomal protein L13